MDTLVVRVNRPKKINYLIQILKSMDFVVSVDRFDKYVNAKNLFDEINSTSTIKGLSTTKEKDIQRVINTYRRGK